MVDTPETWTCDNDNKRVKVEIFTADPEDEFRFDLFDEEAPKEWVEIPTNKVELVVNEDGQADINRYARVDFPTEWDGESVVQYIDGYDPTDGGLTFVRISMKDKNDTYVLQHFGFAGGMGPTSNLGVSKMWVYDINELIKAVPANFSFKHPTPMEVLEKVTEEMNKVCGIMLDPVFIPPNTVDEVTRFMKPRDGLVGRANEAIAQLSGENYDLLDQDELTEQQVEDINRRYNAREADTFGVNTDINLASLQFDITFNEKVFQPNRDTLVDVMNWFTGRWEAKWHVEPFPNGVRLVMDVAPDARSFVQDDVIVDFSEGSIEDAGFGDTVENYTNNDGELPVHNSVRLIKNTALADILPQAVVTVRGETSTSLGDNLKKHAGTAVRNMTGLSAVNFVENRVIPQYDIIPDAKQPAKKYPQATARIEPFFARAEAIGGSEELLVNAALVESDDKSLKAAERTAREELIERAKEVGEGEIEMFGSPRLQPYDRLLTYPTCNTFVPNVAVPPIAYRVSEVRHVAQAGEEYKTSVSVSVFVGEDDISVDSKMIDINDNEDEDDE